MSEKEISYLIRGQEDLYDHIEEYDNKHNIDNAKDLVNYAIGLLSLFEEKNEINDCSGTESASEYITYYLNTKADKIDKEIELLKRCPHCKREGTDWSCQCENDE